MTLTLFDFKQSWLTWKFHCKSSSKITPRYFKDLLEKSFLPHNFRFKSASKTLHLKIKTSVFVILREILLESSHFERDLRSLFTYLLIFFNVLLMFKKQVSSEKWRFDKLLIANIRSLMKIKKSRGPETNPCGTPHSIGWLSELNSSI